MSRNSGKPISLRSLVTHKKKRIPIIDSDGNLVSMVCRKDIVNRTDYPLASYNNTTKQLLVGAAITTHPGYQDRIKALVDSGIDVIVCDSSEGNSKYQIEVIKYLKNYMFIDTADTPIIP